jgi:hypothetical protein
VLVRVWRVAFVCALLAAYAVACGLTADVSGLQGGTRDGGPPDAAPTAESGTPGFCASLAPPPRFCADFDEGGPIGGDWTLIDLSFGQTVALDTSLSFSPPASFLSTVNTNDAPASARLQESLPLLSTHAHVTFEMLLGPGAGSFELAAVHEVTSDGVTYGLFYKFDGHNLSLYLRTLGADGGEITFTHDIGPPPPKWMNVDIDLDITDSATIVVKHDGSTVFNQSGVPTSTASRASLYVEIGVYNFKAAAIQANFDNITIDWR